MFDFEAKFESLIDKIKSEAPFEVELAIVLGSGLGDFAEKVNTVKSIPTVSLPDYPPSTVEGHSGKIHFVDHNGKKVLLFQGRIHFYEGYKISECLLPVFISYKLGAKKILLTNAAGGVNSNFAPGDLMLTTSFLYDMIKKELSQVLPLAEIETRNKLIDFPSKQLNEVILNAALDEKIHLKEGTYWYMKGPSYETPAEIRMIKNFGGDAVGMSTAHEAIFAATLGMKVAAISCITNFAAGISDEKLSHEDVTRTAELVKDKFARLVKKFIDLA
jgi:purine-nucleoside phosphorylase